MKLDQVVKNAKTTLHKEVKTLLLKQPMTEGELADALDIAPKVVRAIVQEMRGRQVRVLEAGGKFVINSLAESGGHVVIANPTGIVEVGFLTDTHICNRHFRKDVAEAAYDEFAERGIKAVVHSGNMIEGEARFNKQDLLVFGMDDQIEAAANEYPYRPNITTYFITGDDHEGWYSQRERINIGRHMEDLFARKGRKDLKYIGHVEADIEFSFQSKSSVARAVHPGGGSSYAYSYTSQKIVEAYQGGEKPSLIFGGHYHKFDYSYPREVHFVQGGCVCDQTMFMRKNKIAAHVGYCRLKIEQDQFDGHLKSVEVGWKPFYDRGYYEARFQ